MISGAVIQHWPRTHPSRALSVAESEHYAIVARAAIGMVDLALKSEV